MFKISIQTKDKYVISGFLINLKNRIIFSVPSQIGCLNACDFCISKNVAFKRNIKEEEFLELINLAKNEMNLIGIKESMELSFTGEGEPLYNIKEINKVLTNESVLKIFNEFKVSFSGKGSVLLNKIENKNKVNIQFSLHEMNEEERRKIIPRTDSFKQIKENIKKEKSNFKSIQINYLNGNNFDEKDLIELFDWIECGINKISFNSLLFKEGFDEIKINDLLLNSIPIEVVKSEKIAKDISRLNFYKEMTFKSV